MAFSLRRFVPDPRKLLRARGGDVSASYRELLESSRSRLKIQVVALVGLAVGTGFLAYRHSLERARDEWLRNNPPSLRTWLHVVRSAGFVEMPPSIAKDQATENAPFIPRPEDELHLDADAGILVLSRPEGMFFFARGTPRIFEAKRAWRWEALGRGWLSAEALSIHVFIDPARGPAPSRRIARGPADPKRLTY